MNARILEASISDIRAISEVQKETWLATFPNEEYGITREDILGEDFFGGERIKKRAEIISNPASNTKFWVAKEGGTVIGYSCARRLPEYNKIRALYVLPAYQGQGIGTALMNAMLSWLDPKKPTKLTVAVYSDQAISFYEKCGFEKGERLAKNPEGPFISGREVPEMEMTKKAA